jgi:hypothetical protein
MQYILTDDAMQHSMIAQPNFRELSHGHSYIGDLRAWRRSRDRRAHADAFDLGSAVGARARTATRPLRWTGVPRGYGEARQTVLDPSGAATLPATANKLRPGRNTERGGTTRLDSGLLPRSPATGLSLAAWQAARRSGGPSAGNRAGHGGSTAARDHPGTR